MKTYKQNRENLSKFLSKQKHDIFAPVKTDAIRFEKISNPNQIHLEKKSAFPAKYIFFPKKEVMLKFRGKNVFEQKPSPRPFIVFGLRKCDLNAIHRQDLVYENDPYYTKRRAQSVLIGYHCNEPDSDYCFCNSMPQLDYFDIMYYPRNGYYVVEAGSNKGQELIEQNVQLFEPFRALRQTERKTPGADRLKVKDVQSLYNNNSWEKVVKDCLACGACTSLCPTCYCFEIHDDGNERSRHHSSCQVLDFSRVAGDHVFRKEHVDRFKHRIFHQLSYFKKKYGIELCVGCGRCIEGCPTRIDFVQKINEMQK